MKQLSYNKPFLNRYILSKPITVIIKLKTELDYITLKIQFINYHPTFEKR